MNFKIPSIWILLVLFVGNLSAQKFLEPNFTFSHKQNSYITLADGTTIEGEIDDLDRKKGLIEEIKIKDLKGKKHKLKPEQVKFMYLPPSGWDKFAGAYDFLTDATKWEDTDLDKEIIGKGYAYFEQAEVMVKKKKMTLLVQLLNPSFSSRIKVYHDPLAQETMALGVGGINVVGGDAKSYYVSIKGGTAEKLYKKNYEDWLSKLYSDCPDLVKELKKDLRWVEFEKHVYRYGKECK